MIKLQDNRLVAVIPHYHEARKEQVAECVSALLSGSMPVDMVYVFNNNANYRLAFANTRVSVINSGFNFGSSIRYAIAYASGADIIICCDDDIAVGEKDVETLFDFLVENPNSIVGHLGSTINDKYDPYVKRKSIVAKQPTEVDVVLGRISAMTRETLACFFSAVYDMPLSEFGNHEDIPLSMQNRLNGNNNYVIPLNPVELGDKGVGLEFQEDHFPHRNDLARKFL